MKKQFKFLSALFLFIFILGFFAIIYMKNSKYSNTSNNFVTLLKSDGKNSSLQVMDLDKGTTIYKSNVGKTSGTFYCQTSIFKSSNITMLNNQNGISDIYYLTNKAIKKIGSLPAGVFSVQNLNNYLYVLSYNLKSKQREPILKKFKNTDLKNPIKTYDLSGDIQDFKISKTNGNSYITSIENGNTYLYSIINDEIKKEDIFNEQVTTNITINNDKLILGCGDKLIGDLNTSKNLQKEPINKIYIKYIGKPANSIISMPLAPYKLESTDKYLYIVSGINESKLDIYDLADNKLVQEQDLGKEGQVYGISSFSNMIYIYTEKDILVINGKKVIQKYAFNNNSLISMQIN